MALGRRERELIELVVERVDEDLVELLAIHGGLGFERSTQRPRVLLEVGESFLQSLERVPHAALDGVFGRSGDLGDLLKGEVCHVAEEKHLALLVGKRFDRRHDLDLDLARDRAALGRRARMQVGDLLAERRAFAVLRRSSRWSSEACRRYDALRMVIDAEVARDRVGPSGELGLVLERARALDDPYENLLNEVLRGRGRHLELAKDEVEDGRLVPLRPASPKAARSPRW